MKLNFALLGLAAAVGLTLAVPPSQLVLSAPVNSTDMAQRTYVKVRARLCPSTSFNDCYEINNVVEKYTECAEVSLYDSLRSWSVHDGECQITGVNGVMSEWRRAVRLRNSKIMP